MSLLDRYSELSECTAIYPSASRGKKSSVQLTVMTQSFLYPAMGLAGEAGEVLNKFKKTIRDDKGLMTPERRAELLDELGDVFWYWYRCCVELDMDPQQVIRANMEKLDDRRKRGKLGGSGDER